MQKIFMLSLMLALPLACSGKSESEGAAGQGGHPAAGQAGSSATHTGGSGGGSGAAEGGSGMSAAGVGGTNNNAGRAGRGGAGAGAGGTDGGSAGTRGGDSGGGGRGGADTGGRSEAGIGGVSGAGTSGAGASGEAGMSGNGGKVCGGRSGGTCEAGQYCDYESGTCGSHDETGVCTTQPGGIACVQGYVCGCDGKVYSNLCMAHVSGVDTWSDNQCVPGNGDNGDPCLVDDDCADGLKCCSSPIQVISCTTPMGSGCPLTP